MVKVDARDYLVIHDNCPDDWEIRDRVAVLVHGLGGNHQSGYMKRIAAKLNAHGIRTMRVDLRGFGSSMYTCRGHAHVGRSDDIDLVLEDVFRCCPRSPVTLMGFSFGGNIVLKLLAEYGDDIPDPLDSSVVVAPPINLTRCAQNLRTGLARLYDRFFVHKLKHVVWRRRKRVNGLVDMPQLSLPDRLLKFDDQFTAPLNGFSGAREYYTMCSTDGLLDRVCLRTLLLVAKNDPLIPYDMFDGVPLSPAITMHAAESGGHLGFVSHQNGNGDRRWMDWKILEWVQGIEQESTEYVEE